MDVSLKDKVRYLNKNIEQKCQPHAQNATLICASLDCQLHPYLCRNCITEHKHPHHDLLLEPSVWIGYMAEQISNSKPSRVKIFQTQYKPNQPQPKTDFMPYIAELKRILGLIEELESQLLVAIRESKAKIQSYIRKYQDYGSSRLQTHLHLYSNPYLLVNKINSQGNDSFLQEVKRILRGDKNEFIDSFNPKYELITLQNKLKTILAAPAQQIFANPAAKQVSSNSPQLQMMPQGSVQLEGLPEKVFAKGETLVVCYKGSTHLLLNSKRLPEERVGVSFIKCSLLTSQAGVNFVGISKDNMKQLITYTNFSLGSFTFPFSILSLLLYFQNGHFYAILGRQQGKLSLFDMDRSQILATLQQGHNYGVRFIEPWAATNKVISCGESTSLSLYTIRSDSREMELNFEEEIRIETGRVQQLAVKGNFAVILSEQRSVLVLDLVMRVQYKTSFAEVCRPFDFVSILSESEEWFAIATHNKGEKFLCYWWVEKGRNDSIRMERVGVPSEGGQDGRVVEMSGGQLWVMYPHEGRPQINSFNLVVA